MRAALFDSDHTPLGADSDPLRFDDLHAQGPIDGAAVDPDPAVARERAWPIVSLCGAA